MIIEYTIGQFIIIIGMIMLGIGIIGFLKGVKDTYDDASLITGIALLIVGIITIIAGLNIDYGFLVFKLVDN